ncbi:hypothetical protein GCM10009715_16370 [Paeniglutamicibacter psychrophenolicus]
MLDMADEERISWVSVVSCGLGMLAFAGVVLMRVIGGTAVAEQNYSMPMIACMAVMMVPILAAKIWTGTRNQDKEDGPDERDREIARRGDQARYQVLLATCVPVLSMAFSGAEHFWIAAAVFAGLGTSFIVGAGVQIGGYRRGVPAW